MNLLRSCKRSVRWGIPLVVAAAAVGIVAAAVAKDAAPKPAKKKLDGAQLYAINCNRCHAERYPTERTAAQWKTLILHMRTRAQLPAEDARAILKYLQEDAGQ